MPPSSKRYGIDRAIELMRSLRAERDPDLVAMVITTTLESVDTKVTDIIEEARSRQAVLEARIAVIKERNAALESEIERGVDEIVELEASLAETMSVTERLELAHNHQVRRATSTSS
jgi:septal ring factor EnvC (AmiA/AmiB activator)